MTGFTVGPSGPWEPADGWHSEDPHPGREDFPTNQAYEHAFYMWRARQRDGRLNNEELAAQFEVMEAFILGQAAGQRPS